jgi:hypothetical protein
MQGLAYLRDIYAERLKSNAPGLGVFEREELIRDTAIINDLLGLLDGLE